MISSCRSLLSLLPFLCFSLNAQLPSTPGANAPIFRINGRAVAVDVVVTGTDGHSVPGLQQTEFKVFEDAKEEKIDSFEEHSPGSVRASITPLPPNVYSNEPPGAGDSINIVLLDELNTMPQDQHSLFDSANRLLNAMPARARVALFILRSKLDLVRGLTTDISTLTAALRNGRSSAGAHGSATRSQQDDSDDRITAAVLEANGGRYEGGEELKELHSDQRMTLTRNSLGQLGRNLAGLPGRKNLIWFAGSFPVSLLAGGDAKSASKRELFDLQNLRKAAGFLAESKIAVYPVSVQGVLNDASANAFMKSERADGGDLKQADEDQRIAQNANRAAMEKLARETGGRAIYNTNDFAAATARALNDGEHYYTLVYTPAGTHQDGKLHRIEVKLDRGNVRPESRGGNC